MKKKHFYTVAIVGKTNVGKSTLFNRLTDKTKSIVFDRCGVTRDSIREVIHWADTSFELVDTAGVEIEPNANQEKTERELSERIASKRKEEIAAADLVIFMASIRDLPSSLEISTIRALQKQKKEIVLLLNKADTLKAEQDYQGYYDCLGIKKCLFISASHGRGIASLLEHIAFLAAQKEKTDEVSEEEYRVALLGRPNVGKSSLLNALIKEERAIVANFAGTTREPLVSLCKLHKEFVSIVDTAGVRRQKSVDDLLEQRMVKESLRQARACDIAIIVVDGTERRLSDQDIKLLFYAYEQRSGIILVINKVDLMTEQDKKQFEESMKKREFLLDKVIVVWLSCLTGKKVSTLREEVHKLRLRLAQRFSSTDVNDYIQTRLSSRHALFSRGERLKLFKIRQVVASYPTFVLHVGSPEIWRKSHVEHIENLLRRQYDLQGCYIQLSIKHATG